MDTVLIRTKTNNIIEKDNHAELLIERKDGTTVIVLIDKEDIPIVSKYTWHAICDKTLHTISYYICHRYNNNINGKGCIKLHRLVTNCPKDKVIDHINHNTCDNRKCNLKICTAFENQQNLRSCHSGQTGVYYNNHKQRWIANISKDCKRIYIGQYKTKEEAINARKEFQAKLYPKGGDA